MLRASLFFSFCEKSGLARGVLWIIGACVSTAIVAVVLGAIGFVRDHHPDQLALEATKGRLEEIARCLRIIHDRGGQWPEPDNSAIRSSLFARDREGMLLTSMNEARSVRHGLLVDSWKSPFVSIRAPGDSGMIIRSSGPDLRPGTADDIIILAGPPK